MDELQREFPTVAASYGDTVAACGSLSSLSENPQANPFPFGPSAAHDTCPPSSCRRQCARAMVCYLN